MRKYICAFVLAFLMSFCIVKWLPLEVSSELDLPVHNVDTGLNYATIQESIDASETLDGHTILVDAGTYYEHVIVDKALSIVGHDKFNTIIDGNGTGIVVHVKSGGVMITGFTIQNGGNVMGCSGIHVAGSDTNMSHIIIRNAYRGIFVIDSSRNVLSDIQVSNHKYGIHLYYSSRNVLSDIQVSMNDQGIVLGYSSRNVLSDIQVSMNDQGIVLFRSGDNMIFHNNFLNNTESLSSDGSLNSLDNGMEGNYWSDYEGADDDQDGIGDTAYVVNENNTDHFPLMGMFFGFKVVYEDKKHIVSVISNSTVSDLHFNETVKMLNFDVAHTNSTVAFCRVMIVKVLVNEPYVVLVDGDRVNATVFPVSNGTHAFLYFTCVLSSREVTIASKPFYELLEKYNTLLENYHNLNLTFYQLLADYNSLNQTYWQVLANYTQLQAAYDSLKQTYEQVLANYTQLLTDYNTLNQTYQETLTNYIALNETHEEVLSNYTKLIAEHNLLNQTYQRTLANYTELLAKHDSLNQTYQELIANHTKLQNDYSSIQTDHNALLEQYNSLNSTYNKIESEYANTRMTFWCALVAATAIMVVTSSLTIRYHRRFGEQKKLVEKYKSELERISLLDAARALFKADVKRRREKIGKFEEKYGVRVQPRNTLEDVIKSLGLKEKVKD